MADRLCKNCSYWAAYPGKSSGECRRYAPHPFYVHAPHPFYVAYYADTTKATSSGPFAPGTKADFWCGEFKERSTRLSVAADKDGAPYRPRRVEHKKKEVEP